MLRNNINIALRKLLKRKEFTIINIFGLAVGLTTTLFILLWVNDELEYDRFHTDLDRIYGVWGNTTYGNGDISTGSDNTGSLKKALEDGFPEVEKVVRYNSNPEVQLSVGDKSFKEKGVFTDEEFFQVFKFDFVDGSLNENSLATGNDIILTESMALKLFGKTTVTGQTVRLDNLQDVIVQGVVVDPPKNSQFKFAYALSMEYWLQRNEWAMGWGNGAMLVFLKINENSSAEILNAKIEGLIKKNQESSSKTLFLKDFKDIYLYGKYENGEMVGGRIEYVRLFSIIAVFIIFIACINFINLSIADAFKRAKEVGVRKVVGAGKASLISNFLIESGLLVLVSFVLSVVSIEFLLPGFNTLTGKAIALNWWNPTLMSILLGLAILTTLISGLYPALVLAGFKPIQALKGKVDLKGAGGTGSAIRKGLVVFQFVVSGFLIFSTLIIGKQIDFIFNNQQNVDREGVIVLKNDYGLIEKYESFRSELLNDPSIEAVTSIGELPINVNATTGDPVWEGKNELTDKTYFRLLFTEQDFVPAMNLKLVEGRNFSRELKSDSTSIILNEAAVRGMNMKDPLGKIVRFWGYDAIIIGVVEDFHLNSVYEEIEPLIVMNWVENTENIVIRAKSGMDARALEVLEDKYAEFMSGYIFDYDFLSSAHERMYKSELLIKDLARIFGGIAIFISCLGLFGLTSINAQRNIKEIGIRKVLGANMSQILLRFSRQSLILPTLALVLMIPLAYYFLNSWLEGFAYHIDIMASNFIVVIGISLIIAWLTVSFIAFKAAKSNPVNSLRNE